MGRNGGRGGGGRPIRVNPRDYDSYREAKPDTPTAFDTKAKSDGSGKTDTLFNVPGQAGVHGHVTESQTSAGQTQYHYARDNEGNTYIDDNRNSGTYTGHQTEQR